MIKKVLKTAAFALCMTAFAHGASVPVQNMSPWSIAAEYYGGVNGHELLMLQDNMSIASHMLRLHYAPAHFLRFSGGVGIGHSYASPTIEGAEAGFAATGGIGLYLTKLLDFLSLTGGYDAYYLNASDNDKYYASTSSGDGSKTGGTYKFWDGGSSTSGVLHIPYFGLIFHIGRFFDVEVGGQYRYFAITHSAFSTYYTQSGIVMETTDSYDDEVEDVVSKQVRAYGSLTLHERESGAYITIGASYAPVLDDKYDIEGRYHGEKFKYPVKKDNLGQMARFSIWGQIGLIMRDPRGGAKKKGEYSEAYIELKERQDSMAEALQRDIERDKERNREDGRDEHDFEEN